MLGRFVGGLASCTECCSAPANTCSNTFQVQVQDTCALVSADKQNYGRLQAQALRQAGQR